MVREGGVVLRKSACANEELVQRSLRNRHAFELLFEAFGRRHRACTVYCCELGGFDCISFPHSPRIAAEVGQPLESLRAGGAGRVPAGRRGGAGFGRRRVAPRVGIVDRKPYVRIFLAETFEDLGFVPSWARASEILPSLDAVEPDLVVIVVPDEDQRGKWCSNSSLRHGFGGRVMLMGSRGMPASQPRNGSASSLGSKMLPVLGTPFRTRELKERLADLVPVEAPPPLPVDLVEAFANDWLELWYQPKIDPRALMPRGAEALIRVRHPAWGIVPPAHFLPEEGDPHFRALSDFVVLKAMADWTQFAIEWHADRDRDQSAGRRARGS